MIRRPGSHWATCRRHAAAVRRFALVAMAAPLRGVQASCRRRHRNRRTGPRPASLCCHARRTVRHRFGGKEGKAGPIVRDACIRNGLMVRGIRDSLVFCPPLVISEAEVDKAVEIIRKSLDEVTPALRAIPAA